MHYHPWRDMVWFPVLTFVLTGLLGIPLTVLSSFFGTDISNAINSALGLAAQ